MDGFRILSNRKRTFVALVHTVLFLAIAMAQLALSKPVPRFMLHAHSTTSSAAMVAVYFVVTVVLLALFWYSRPVLERLYFALCASSASFGLLRAVFGDPPMHSALLLRVLMLSSAVLVGYAVFRGHCQTSES